MLPGASHFEIYASRCWTGFFLVYYHHFVPGGRSTGVLPRDPRVGTFIIVQEQNSAHLRPPLKVASYDKRVPTTHLALLLA